MNEIPKACTVPIRWTGETSPRDVHTVLREIHGEAARLFGVKVAEIAGRRRRFADARHWCCQRMRARGFSFPAIADAMRVDHTTVIYACRKPPIEPGVNALGAMAAMWVQA